MRKKLLIFLCALMATLFVACGNSRMGNNGNVNDVTAGRNAQRNTGEDIGEDIREDIENGMDDIGNAVENKMR